MGLGALSAGTLVASACRGPRLDPVLPGPLDALLVVLSDTHSAQERYPGTLALVDRVRAAHPGVPLHILHNGDLHERGNGLALRGAGGLDLDFLEGLRDRASVHFNLGNHEGALQDLAVTTERLRGAGATVVSNAVDLRTNRSFAAPVDHTVVGGLPAAIVGLATNDLPTWRAEVRGTLRIPDGPDYVRAHLRPLLGEARVVILLSHEGTQDDRSILELVPDGALVVGGHDHLAYSHRTGRTLYIHVGSWGEAMGVVGLRLGAEGPEWSLALLPVPLDGEGPVDRRLAMRVREEEGQRTAAELEVVGWSETALTARAASLWAVEIVRRSAGADAALIGNTTFGAGLPRGPVRRHHLEAFLRFDNPLVETEVEGLALARILDRSNQFGEIPFEARTGEFLVAAAPEPPVPSRRHRVVTDRWIQLNAARYLGMEPEFWPLEGATLRGVIAGGLR